MTSPESSSIGNAPVALVTGASRGIGRAIAIELARTGHDVMINYAANNSAAAEACATARAAALRKDARIRMCRADVSETNDREELLEATHQQFGRLDLRIGQIGLKQRHVVIRKGSSSERGVRQMALERFIDCGTDFGVLRRQ